MRAFKFFGIFLIVFSCIEPYHFVITDESPALVVEGYISDQSFNDTRTYPSDGRYFTIKLTTTSNVTNVRPTPVSDAGVKLISDANEEWSYQESFAERGLYELYDSAFEAKAGVKYKIRISTEEETYESSWEAMPNTHVPPIGTVGFEETESQKYVIEANESVLRTIKEIKTHISINENNSGETIYYRWKLTPMWVFIAPLSPSKTRPGYICWVTSRDYLKTYSLQVDNAGGYDKDLFSIPTIANERILDDFSVLIQQYAMTENNYFFWKEMYDQNEGNVLVDKPPFNLQSNFKSLSGEKKIIGYFGVVQEQATRWYFNKSQLSYPVKNAFKEGCEVYYGPPAPGCPEPTPAYPACPCKYCLEYPFGDATNVRPSWWKK
ncbi:DUF4249 domain-containing protein [Chryseolinea sp. H1M3-3]|uniref:DUF4249 domain-containing protein n=1 Tax=Chryseolinea sp. H1M3-3 TaxID=3034144 RepID=UPI0023EC78A8|nr:DUF4249 domain-containing protein [Chryseolinea sp. H1M3-3]